MACGLGRQSSAVSMVRAFILCALLLVVARCTRAQCPVPRDPDAPPQPRADLSRATDGEGLLPESGYLSDRVYTSLFFGFELDLPIPLEGHRMMLPLMPPGQHALLALAMQEGSRHGSLTVTATEPSNPTYVMTEKERREEFQRWAENKPPMRQQQPDWTMRSGRFDHIEQRKGDTATLQYSTRIKNYRVRIVIVTNDTAFLKSARHSVETVRIYCPEVDGTLTTPKGEKVIPEGAPYEGPTVPTARVEARLTEKPEEHARSAGQVNDGVYRNAGLDLEYTLPQGWIALDTGAAPEDGMVAASEQRIHDFLHACSWILVRATRETRHPEHAPSAEIVLRALDPTCLSLRSPMTIDDRLQAEYLAAYLGMLGEFGDIQSTELIAASGRVFAVYGGTIGSRGSEQDLKMRDSEMIFATRYNKLLLLWSLIIPQGSDWNTVPQTRASFGGRESVEIGPALAKK